MDNKDKLKFLIKGAEDAGIPKAPSQLKINGERDDDFYNGYHLSENDIEPSLYFKNLKTARLHSRKVQGLLGAKFIVVTVPHGFGFTNEIQK